MPPVEPSHDPKQTLDELRDHLALQDRPLAFLFGAGTSCAVNIAPTAAPGAPRAFEPLVPDMGKLTGLAKAEVVAKGAAFSEAWQKIEAEFPFSPNIEHILSCVEAKIEAVGNDTLVGLSKAQLQETETVIRQTIAGKVNPTAIPNNLPHGRFARWVRNCARNVAVELFTTNYDVLLERSLEKALIPVFDGFVGSFEPFFSAEATNEKSLDPGQGYLKLWKIHGSVNWQLRDSGVEGSIVRTTPTTSGELIYPSKRKYEQSRKMPYFAILDRLDQFLSHRDALIISCGFSFSDDHINDVVFRALDRSNRAHLVSLQYSELPNDHVLVKRAVSNKNIRILGPETGVISGFRAPWKLGSPVSKGTAHFLDIGFDTRAAIIDPEDALRGSMRLGDFNWFARFLEEMVTRGAVN
jgi:hypothetical protein